MKRRNLLLTAICVACLSILPINATAADEEETPPVVMVASVVSINQADAKQLQEIPGVGQTIAARIVEFRSANGNFKSVDELTKVKGIGEKRLSNIKSRITL